MSMARRPAPRPTRRRSSVWVRARAPDPGPRPLNQHLVAHLAAAEERAHLHGQATRAVRGVTRRRFKRSTRDTRHVDDLVAHQGTSPSSPVRIAQIHHRRAEAGAADENCSFVHIALLLLNYWR